VLDYRGQELTAEQTSDGDWSVTLGGWDARARYLDYAMAELLGVPPGQAIPLATLIVQQLPTEPGENGESSPRGTVKA
jgi:hypothetical protein